MIRPNSIRVQATLDVAQKSLQGLLYQLESRTPYVFVDSLAVQIPSRQDSAVAGNRETCALR